MGAIFQSMNRWSFTLNPLWHLSVKMFFLLIIIPFFYLFRYCCWSCYFGRTIHKFDVRIEQHVPTKIRKFIGWLIDNFGKTKESSISEYFINNFDCAMNLDLFSIISKSHSSFRLKVFETIYILSCRPSICKQKKCLLGLNIISI